MNRRSRVLAEMGSCYSTFSNVTRLNCSFRRNHNSNFYVKKNLGFNMWDSNLKHTNIGVQAKEICLGTSFSPWMCQLELGLVYSNRKQTNGQNISGLNKRDLFLSHCYKSQRQSLLDCQLVAWYPGSFYSVSPPFMASRPTLPHGLRWLPEPHLLCLHSSQQGKRREECILPSF